MISASPLRGIWSCIRVATLDSASGVRQPSSRAINAQVKLNKSMPRWCQSFAMTQSLQGHQAKRIRSIVSADATAWLTSMHQRGGQDTWALGQWVLSLVKRSCISDFFGSATKVVGQHCLYYAQAIRQGDPQITTAMTHQVRATHGDQLMHTPNSPKFCLLHPSRALVTRLEPVVFID